MSSMQLDKHNTIQRHLPQLMKRLAHDTWMTLVLASPEDDIQGGRHLLQVMQGRAILSGMTFALASPEWRTGLGS